MGIKSQYSAAGPDRFKTGTNIFNPVLNRFIYSDLYSSKPWLNKAVDFLISPCLDCICP